jgi:CheY-like chemotaxis protein
MTSKILVVDDSKVMHGMYEMMLRRYAGCTVVHAMNGSEALDQMQKNADCQLVILDINMPVMGGLEFLRRFKGPSSSPSIPVIIVSTEGREGERRRGLDEGATAYLTKPFQPSELHALIDRILGDRSK